MAVVGCQNSARLEVADDRRVDEEPEDPRADKIPETDGHQEVERPLMPERRLAVRHRDEIPGIEGQQDEGHDLERRERRGERHIELGLAGEIPVMAGADDAAAENENDVEINGAQRSDPLDQTKLVEEDA